MMFRAACLALLCVLSFSFPAAAQDITRGQIDRNAPIVVPRDMISREMSSQLFQQCRSFYPRRFTPTALERYCDCSIPATQLSLTGQEYAELQDPKNRVYSNATYQKYVTYVVAPCMTTPTIDIEYLACALDRFGDTRINNLPRFCQCVGQGAAKFVKNFGDIEMLMTMRTNNRIADPFEALWLNPRYMENVRQNKDRCLSSYMSSPTVYHD